MAERLEKEREGRLLTPSMSRTSSRTGSDRPIRTPTQPDSATVNTAKPVNSTTVRPAISFANAASGQTSAPESAETQTISQQELSSSDNTDALAKQMSNAAV